MAGEIRFRGRCLNNGKWVYGYLYEAQGLAWIIYERGLQARLSEPEWVGVDPQTVGQYVNRVDKNGRGIYVGDIVSVRDGVYDTLIYYHSIVQFYKGNFCLNPQAVLKGGKEQKDISVSGGYEWQQSNNMEVISSIQSYPEEDSNLRKVSPKPPRVNHEHFTVRRG